MTPEEAKSLLAKSSNSTKLANAGNSELLQALGGAPRIQPGAVDTTRPLHHSEKELQEAMRLREKAIQMRHTVALGIRPTTDEEKLNKTEREYLRYLEGLGDFWIGVQCLTLKIGHDCRYTPDFCALDKDGLRVIDTKARRLNKRQERWTVHVEDDSKVKLSAAARLFPWIRFVIAWKQEGIWQHKEIKP